MSRAPDDDGGGIAARKDAHLDLCLDDAVHQATLATGLGGHRLEYDALPEVDLDAVDLSTVVLGKRLSAPIVIGAMTGGTDRARTINERLAIAAERTGVAMALGSQRAMVVDPARARTFAVREVAPGLPLLFANLGAVQLNYGVTAADVERLMRAVSADALNLHLNPLQEAIQPGGDTRFFGLLEKIRGLAAGLGSPVVVKEVGAGLSRRTLEKLRGLPLAGVEVAGVGGTSWTKVEALRAPAGSPAAEVGRRLAGFGVPTAESIVLAREVLGPQALVVGSGGLRTGYDLAVAIALGADVGALARPFLLAAESGVEAVVQAIETLKFELRVLCFATGSRDLGALRQVRVTGPDRRTSP